MLPGQGVPYIGVPRIQEVPYWYDDGWLLAAASWPLLGRKVMEALFVKCGWKVLLL